MDKVWIRGFVKLISLIRHIQIKNHGELKKFIQKKKEGFINKIEDIIGCLKIELENNYEINNLMTSKKYKTKV